VTNLYFYFLFRTSAPDGSAFFGIHRSENPSWGTDGSAINYIGNGPKLAQKARQFGIERLTTEVLFSDPVYDIVKRRLDQILTPATLSDPRCLNMPREEINKAISEGLKDKPKSEEHRLNIAHAMVQNDNALAHVKSDDTKDAISKAMEGNQNAVKSVDESSKASTKKAKTKLKWWHNKTTGEEVTLEEEEEGLTGFELGRLPKEYAQNFKKDRKKELSDADRAILAKD